MWGTLSQIRYQFASITMSTACGKARKSLVDKIAAGSTSYGVKLYGTFFNKAEMRNPVLNIGHDFKSKIDGGWNAF